jgi:hypothetical protein
MKNQQLHGRVLRLENLEQRHLLAGNVTVAVTNGDLVITGDGSSNFVEISATVNAGEYVVKGLFLNAVTKINQGTNAVTVSGVTDDFNINLNGGNDKIRIGSLAQVLKIPDDITMNTQVGNDTVIMQRVTADSLFSNLGNATDATNNTDTLNLNSCNFRTGKMDTGAGADKVTIAGTKFRTKFDMNTGLGADIVKNTNVLAGIANLTLGGAEDDKDELTATKATITNAATILLGGGNDKVIFAEAKVTNRVTLDLGDGNDTGTISSSSAGEVYLLCGAGDDVGNFTGPLTVGNVFARGGDGIDTGTVSNIDSIEVSGDYDVDEFEGGDL